MTEPHNQNPQDNANMKKIDQLGPEASFEGTPSNSASTMATEYALDPDPQSPASNSSSPAETSAEE
jgi:hypothetical protein